MRKIEEQIEAIIAAYPIFQYKILGVDELQFTESVRHICRTECKCFGTSWSCPPAVGTVEECRSRCHCYEKVLLFTTLAETEDASDWDTALKTKKEHEEITKNLLDEFYGLIDGKAMGLSGESCQICERCTYPQAPCRYPKRMLPCIESYGILITETAEKNGIDFYYDSSTITWFGMIFYSLNRQR